MGSSPVVQKLRNSRFDTIRYLFLLFHISTAIDSALVMGSTDLNVIRPFNNGPICSMGLPLMTLIVPSG